MSRKRVDTYEMIIALALHIKTQRPKLSAYSIAETIDRLTRIARTLSRMYEESCNGVDSGETCKACEGSDGKKPCKVCDGTCDMGAARHYRKIARLQDRAQRLGTEVGIIVVHQTDPRGAPMQVVDANHAVDGQPRTIAYLTGER